MIGISNIFINDVLFQYTKYFKGVYSCDDIPSTQLLDKQSIIVNLSKTTEIGTHFIAFIKLKNTLYIFDSLKLDMYNEYISEYIKTYRCKKKHSLFRIQSYDSEFCGFYCMAFVMFCTFNYFRQFYTLFVKRKTQLNENRCISIIIYCIKNFL